MCFVTDSRAHRPARLILDAHPYLARRVHSGLYVLSARTLRDSLSEGKSRSFESDIATIAVGCCELSPLRCKLDQPVEAFSRFLYSKWKPLQDWP
eukprot:4447300-Pleurochrysis_carterae.AAC.1